MSEYWVIDNRIEKLEKKVAELEKLIGNLPENQVDPHCNHFSTYQTSGGCICQDC